MAAAGWVRSRSDRVAPGGGNAGRAPTEGARRVGGLAVAGVLPAGLALAAGLAVALAVASSPGLAGASVGAESSAHSPAPTIRISTAKVPHVGTVLTTTAGLTLYRFTVNPPGTSKCTGACAKVWPPLMAAKGDHIAGPHGVKGLSVIDVGGGQWQVAFHDVALYRFEGDTKKGQAKGQGVAGDWFAVLKSGITAVPAAASAAGTGAAATSTSTTAPASSTTQPMTSTTQAPHAVTTGPAPAAQAPATQAPVAPPTTTPTTAPTTAPAPPPTTAPAPPPTTAPTTPTTSGGGGYGY